MNKLIFIVSLLLVLTGCDVIIGGDLYFNQINQIEDSLEDPDWDTINSQAKELKHMYKRNKWKLQLLGDEGEYERLDESINKLITAIKEKDMIFIRMELTMIQTDIENIYSL